MKPVSQYKVHCFKHAYTHSAQEECIHCLLELMRKEKQEEPVPGSVEWFSKYPKRRGCLGA